MLCGVGRARSTRRRHTVDDVRWTAPLTKLRATGMPIRRVCDHAALVRAGERNEAERLALLAAHRHAVVEWRRAGADVVIPGERRDRGILRPTLGISDGVRTRDPSPRSG